MKYQEKIEEWVQIFLKHVREISIEKHVADQEGYKFKAVQNFQLHFDIDAVDLAGNLEKAILNNNLVTGAQYWPRKMFIIYAQLFPEETRSLLRDFFDESKDIGSRITEAEKAFYRLNDMRNKKTNEPYANTYIGLRFLSLLLGYRFPNSCNALKPAEWKVFARFLDPEFSIPNKTPAGEQYLIYAKYIDELCSYLKTREDVEVIKRALTNGLEFQDEGYRWMTQDVIYVTARVVAGERAGEKVTPEIGVMRVEKKEIDSGDEEAGEEDGTGFMPLEEYLEEYVVKNWSLMDFGEDLTMYQDESGTPGQQYTTDVGIIDILAKDKDDNFVVIELKRADSGYKVVGQILNYMGWVRQNLAGKNQKVRGLIIVGRADKALKMAVREVAEKVELKEYRVKMNFINPT